MSAYGYDAIFNMRHVPALYLWAILTWLFMHQLVYHDLGTARIALAVARSHTRLRGQQVLFEGMIRMDDVMKGLVLTHL